MPSFRLNIKQGETILNEGEPGKLVYKILCGSVSVYKTVHGKRVLVAQLNQGDLLGEMFLWDEEGRRNATAIAETDVLLEAIQSQEYQMRMLPLNRDQDELIVALQKKLKDTTTHYSQRLVSEATHASGTLQDSGFNDTTSFY